MAEVKIKLSQVEAGALYMKCLELEEKNRKLLIKVGELELKIQSDILDNDGEHVCLLNIDMQKKCMICGTQT